MKLNNLYLGDCLDILKEYPDNCVDSIVTDPPYGIKIMNKRWDYKIPSVEIWEEILRVLKPGGHLLSFGGPRTYHRMVCNIEDAGFEIRDTLIWMYGSGFPKSLNISKAIDKKFGAERRVVGVYRTPDGSSVLSTYNNWQDKHIRNGTQERHVPLVTALSTEETKKWDGWGTALKPAYEPIVLARKPLSEKTIAENVLKWGVGGINIDECRVKYEKDGTLATNPSLRPSVKGGNGGHIIATEKESRYMVPHEQGRWPANILHNGGDEVLDLFEAFGNNKGQQGNVKGSESSECHSNVTSGPKGRMQFDKKDSTGSAARFFYCAKVSPKERGKYNNHPTVKPIALLKYLIKLITPKGGVVLDPFIGSGSTALSAIELGFDWIGVEKEEDTYNIAQRRIEEKKIK
jgi:site-specific DNA-methyltransferase (adenine-specific)